MWYRRGEFFVENIPVRLRDKEMNEDIKSQINNEKRVLSDYLYNKLDESNIKKIGNYYKTINLNKLRVLQKANEAGLRTPATIITTIKSELEAFAKQYLNIISKAISDVKAFEYKDEGYIYTYTSDVNDFDSIEDEFFPTLFQEKIQKKYELRIFYLHGNIYPMAIFSQNDKQTKTDFRNYNYQVPNRNVPYKLPKVLSIKIKKLMNMIGLDTGSIDMIIDKKNNFFFLEVNPVGQYDMVSYPCNYNLHREIAKYLSDA